jgi:hypothetical protein
LRSGLVDITSSGDPAAVDAVLAFVAGFSEPWFLKTVQGLAGLDSTPSAGKPESDT